LPFGNRSVFRTTYNLERLIVYYLHVLDDFLCLGDLVRVTLLLLLKVILVVCRIKSQRRIIDQCVIKKEVVLFKLLLAKIDFDFKVLRLRQSRYYLFILLKGT
jgi:hypothetical protein